MPLDRWGEKVDTSKLKKKKQDSKFQFYMQDIELDIPNDYNYVKIQSEKNIKEAV